MGLLTTLAQATAPPPPPASHTDQQLHQMLTGWSAVVFILVLGLAGVIIALSFIIARRVGQRRRDAMPPRARRRAYSDAWTSAGARLDPPEDDQEDADHDKPS